MKDLMPELIEGQMEIDVVILLYSATSVMPLV